MSELTQEESLLISDRKAAKVVLDRETRRFLMPFINNALSVKEAAQKLELNEKAARNKIARLEDLGLLFGQSGKGVKAYTASAREFKVPFELTEFNNLAEMMMYLSNWDVICQYYEPILNRMFVGNWFINLFAVQHESFLNAAFANDAPPIPEETTVFEGSGDYINLSFEQARELKKELNDLRNKYIALADETPNRQEYFLHLHMVPRPTEDN